MLHAYISNIGAGHTWTNFDIGLSQPALSNVYTIAMEDAEMDTDFIHYTPAGYLTRANNILAAAISNGLI